MTKLALINYVLQILFVRLCRSKEKVITGFKMTSGSGGNVQSYEIREWYSIMGFVLPFSGWSSDYVRLGKPFFFRVTKILIFKG